MELYYGSRGDEGEGQTIGDIEGRTIHSDGTIIPFTGKPYEKLIEKTRGSKVMSKVFSMPDVQVGSIIEYRYQIRYSDYWYYFPEWLIQSELFTRKAHYLWKPTNLNIADDYIGQIRWTPILPPSTEVKETQLPGNSLRAGQILLDLNMHDVPPIPDEDHMPPISNLSYRVLFYDNTYRTGDEFWKSEGKKRSKERDKFIGPGPSVGAAVKEFTAPTDTQTEATQALRSRDEDGEH